MDFISFFFIILAKKGKIENKKRENIDTRKTTGKGKETKTKKNVQHKYETEKHKCLKSGLS